MSNVQGVYQLTTTRQHPWSQQKTEITNTWMYLKESRINPCQKFGAVGNLWRQLSLRIHWVSPHNRARLRSNGPFTETYRGEWTHKLPTHSCPLHCSQYELFYPFIEMHLKQWPSWLSFRKVGSVTLLIQYFLVISHFSIPSKTVCCKGWRENAVVTLSHTITIVSDTL